VYYNICHYSVSQSYDIDFVVQTRKPVMSKRGEIVLVEVYNGAERLQVDGIHVWPAAMFLDALFNGKILP
jgi:hypothetical protein